MSPVAGERILFEPGAGDVRSLWDRIRALLEREQQRLHQEIRAYPTPIPRCDQQFNALIDRREELFEESARLEAAAAAHSGNNDVGVVIAFVDTSRCLDDESRRQLKIALRQRSTARERGSDAAESEARTDHEPVRRAD